ncbi:MAG TPA: hypothetical protein VEZ48_07060 [Sphingomonadaceae bacterium]|nr:hypothetical protein [Sphingomonadaceae bacterium]
MRAPLRFSALLLAAGLWAQPASAQLFYTSPDFRGPPVTGSEPGLGLAVPGATADEYSAHLLWNLRSGLNVAALQCQFSPTLRMVANYNDILAHHGAELAGAYTRLGDYFKRVHGPREGQRLFDDYSTKTYNGFSTLYAQLGFCQTAASISRDALAVPKGGMLGVARLRMREFRNSLVTVGDRLYSTRLASITSPTFSQLNAACYDRKSRLRRVCGGTVK